MIPLLFCGFNLPLSTGFFPWHTLPSSTKHNQTKNYALICTPSNNYHVSFLFFITKFWYMCRDLCFLFPCLSSLSPLPSHLGRSPVLLASVHACFTGSLITVAIYFPSWNFHPLTSKFQDSLVLCPKLCSSSIPSLVNLRSALSSNHYLYTNGSRVDISNLLFSTLDLPYFTSPLECLKNFTSSTCPRLNVLSSCSKLALFCCSLLHHHASAPVRT